ncbi:MAG: hypothetical protein KF718_21210 [Polyangiaceae bacterium]|nr:hypothetical protein [Polyangiaceae bacterium]
MALLACPFCRELFPKGEHERCPECGLDLRSMASLPPSLEALDEEAAAGNLTPPEHRELPWSYFGRGRGVLLAVAVVGLLAFFMPWVEMRRPELVTISGFDLARGRAGWLWGGAVGWFMLIPLVWTRRTLARMRGVRIVCALFCALTLGEVAMMWALPPQGSRYFSVDFSWAWGMYLSAVTSAVGVVAAARFGGSLKNIPALPWFGHVERKGSATLH